MFTYTLIFSNWTPHISSQKSNHNKIPSEYYLYAHIYIAFIVGLGLKHKYMQVFFVSVLEYILSQIYVFSCKGKYTDIRCYFRIHSPTLNIGIDFRFFFDI
jgi:hypothetical protein